MDLRLADKADSSPRLSTINAEFDELRSLIWARPGDRISLVYMVGKQMLNSS
jgi:hypothetical protein